MRICAVSPFPPTRTGIADYGAFLVDGFAHDDRIEHVTVVADRVAGAADHEVRGRIEIRRVWERDRADVGPQVLRAIAATRADVVWFNLGLTIFGDRLAGAASGVSAALGARLMGRPTVVTLHELPSLCDLPALGFDRARAIASGLAPSLLLRSDEVVVTLDRYRSHLVHRHGARNVTHIPHGLWDRAVWSAEPLGETVLVFGMFGPHKDPGLVAEAICRLRRSRPNVRLVIAGGDHPRYPGFMAACDARHHLGDSWIGYVPRESLPTLFASATVTVVPATATSGSSGVIHRGVAHGRALLVSDLPDFRALAAEEGLSFEWFAPGDVNALADRLEALLRDPSRRRALVSHNLEAVASMPPSRTVDAYVDLFARHDPALGVASGRRRQMGLERRLEA